MPTIELNTQEREKTGKEAAKKLRRQGFIPAVMYGYKGNKILAIKATEFNALFEEIGEHAIISLNIEGKQSTEVIVKGFQQDPVKKSIIHVDFYEVEKGKLLKTEIPIKILGTSKGVKKGGILETFVKDVEIECLPKDIPDFIPVHIDDLDIGDSLHVKDIVRGEEIKIISNSEQVVLTIGTPTKISVPVEEAEVPSLEEEVSSGE